MGLLDKIKGNKGSKARLAEDGESRRGSKGTENVLDLVKEPASAKATADKPVPIKEDTGRAYKILGSAHLSEKTNALSASSRYVFKVNPKANKIDVKKAVEQAYDVHVTAVNIVNVKGKKRRMGRTFGQTSDWKKAVVSLKVGEKIQGLVEGV